MIVTNPSGVLTIRESATAKLPRPQAFGFARVAARAIGLLAALIVLSGCVGVAKEPVDAPGVVRAATVRTFFSTDRAEATVEDDAKHFGPRPGDHVFGVGSGNVPLGLPETTGARSLLKFGNRRIRDAVVLDVATRAESGFIEEISNAVRASKKRDVLLFVHGYNTSFNEALRRTAQIAWDTRFGGAVVLFSWPSKTTVTGYTADEAAVNWATTHLTQVLESLVFSTGAERVVLVGHSMGTRALTDAFLRLKQKHGSLASVRHLVLAAPDIDAAVFVRDIAPLLVADQRQVTLYASSRDRALALSEQLHDYPRAGDSDGGLVVYPGIDTVDATNVDTSFLGHNYYGENEALMTDLRELIKSDARPADRSRIEPVGSAIGNYWRLVPDLDDQAAQ